jgi:hypothetical protein
LVQSADDLVARSVALKEEVLEFARAPRFDREFRQAVRARFGGPMIVGDEGELDNFFDWFLQQYRLRDGTTLIDRFVDSRSSLEPAEREFLLGWRGVREGVFEVVGRDGPVLLADNVIDDLRYRIRANVGPQIFDRMPPGSFLITRAVPIFDEWLLSGASQLHPATARDQVLFAAARVAVERPEFAFANLRLRERGWQLQAAQHAAFVEHFGTDEITIPADAASKAMGEYLTALGTASPEHAWAEQEQDDWLDSGAETVGIIYDHHGGLGIYVDYALAEAAFVDPDLMRRRRHKETVKAYLTDESVDPVPMRRLTARYPDTASRVIRTALGKPALSWERDGEQLLAKYKKAWLARPDLPRVSIINDRLRPYVN